MPQSELARARQGSQHALLWKLARAPSLSAQAAHASAASLRPPYKPSRPTSRGKLEQGEEQGSSSTRCPWWLDGAASSPAAAHARRARPTEGVPMPLREGAHTLAICSELTSAACTPFCRCVAPPPPCCRRRYAGARSHHRARQRCRGSTHAATPPREGELTAPRLPSARWLWGRNSI